jgi:ectoine hydroxylase-related dioxygenase (phytanoyl-CoA dioxygenase family)
LERLFCFTFDLNKSAFWRNIMDAPSFADRRFHDIWLKPDHTDFAAFKKAAATKTRAADWPLAHSVEKNILIYDGHAARAAAQDPTARKTLMAEWADALLNGPGVIVIKNAVNDHAAIDQASRVFEAIIADQHKTGTGGGDHFAKPGANDRIWNSLQKHCLADPENFAAYYAADAVGMASEAWLGPDWQMTAQLNRVNPGGAAQSAHRDYHLGFMTAARASEFPAHVHRLSPFMTLQGAIAHCDMPLESGPTLFLPHTQNVPDGYLAFGKPDYQAHFNAHHVQLPLTKGDAVFFNPALMHAAGANRSKDIYRMANLLQVSSAFGRAMETIDRIAMAKVLYPALQAALKSGLSKAAAKNAIACAAEGYAFPTNLDRDPPVGGLAPQSQAAFMAECLENGVSAGEFGAKLDALEAKRRS